MKKSPIVKRSIKLGGRVTSICLEDCFFEALWEISREQDRSLRQVVEEINASRDHANLSSALRIFILNHYRKGSQS